MKNLKESLAYLCKKSKDRVFSTIDDPWQFEINLKHNWLANNYNNRLKFITETFEHIGEEVWRYKPDRLTYSFECSPHSPYNKTEETPVILTQEMYNQFEIDYINYAIENITEQLLTCTPFSKSTNAFSNLQELIEFEAKQEMLNELKELLKGW